MEIITSNEEVLDKFVGYRLCQSHVDRTDGEASNPMEEWDRWAENINREMAQRAAAEQEENKHLDLPSPRQQWELEIEQFHQDRKYYEALTKQLEAQGKEDETMLPPSFPMPPEALIVEEGDSVYLEWNARSAECSDMPEIWHDFEQQLEFLLSQSNDDMPSSYSPNN